MSATSRATSAARYAGDSRPVEIMAKVGIAAMGVVHVLLAWVALQIVVGGGEESADNTGALKELSDSGIGRFVLGLLVVGFAAYAIAQAVAAAIGHRTEDGGKRIVKRVASGAKAAIAVSLGVTCVRLLTGSSQQNSSDQQAGLTAKLMGQPAGQFLVGAVGLAVVAWAGYEIYKGWEAKFLSHIEGDPGPRFTILGRIGYIARGAAFGLLGVLVVWAAITEDPDKARGLDGALNTLAAQPFGSVLLVVVALGLFAFGAFQVITARRYSTD